MQKYISDKLQEVTLIEEGIANGIEFELVMYMYKGKEPVYYTFPKGNKVRGLILAQTYLTAKTLTEWMLSNRFPFAYQIVDGNFRTKKKLSFNELKLFKIIR